jgi:hypothetical protein
MALFNISDLSNITIEKMVFNEFTDGWDFEVKHNGISYTFTTYDLPHPDEVTDVLHAIGAGNIAAWGGIPAAIAIGGLLAGTVGAPFAAGLAVSWGTTALLMGLAKLLKDDPSSMARSDKKNSHSSELRRMRPDDTYEDEPEMDPIKNRSSSSGEKEGSVFYWDPRTGEKRRSEMGDRDELPQGYKRTMGENYRQKQYRRRY